MKTREVIYDLDESNLKFFFFVLNRLGLIVAAIILILSAYDVFANGEDAGALSHISLVLFGLAFFVLTIITIIRVTYAYLDFKNDNGLTTGEQKLLKKID